MTQARREIDDIIESIRWQADMRYLAIGGRTSSEFGNRMMLRVRVGHETRWAWRPVTDAEYQVMLDALNASLGSTHGETGMPKEG